MDLSEVVDRITKLSKETFERKNAVLSLGEYLALLAARPYTLTRNAAEYLRDIFDHHGSEMVPGVGGVARRWRLFNDKDGDGDGEVYGHEPVQERLYDVLNGFVQRGRGDRFILLHGPNGSAKSSLVQALIQAMESYSRTEDGPLFRLSWVFCETGEKDPVGFGRESELLGVDSFARAEERLVTSRIPCEMKDPPFLLLPKNRRREFLEQALAEAPESERRRFAWTDFVARGELSPKNKVIYESLLKAHGGDWSRVVRHVRVERYYVSRNYRVGAVAIEPQATIDAGVAILSHGHGAGLPPVLAHEMLLEARGDLIDANCGIVEYSDFLKRNPEANKFLLTTAERGSLNLPGMTVSLNILLVGGTNEKFLAAFKRDPTFPSFKGRFELIRVPYLLEYSKETQIYQRHLQRIRGGKSVAPHTARIAALWAVLTRLRRPDPKHYDGELARVIRRLTPLDKARLYDSGTVPRDLNDEERRLLRENVERIANEFSGVEEEFEGFIDAAYEGRRGASAREIMTLLTDVLIDAEGPAVGPVDLLEALPRLIADPSLYSYLRRPPEGGYHDPHAFVETCRREYLRLITQEVQKASDLVADTEYGRLFGEYLQHVRAFGTGEKRINPQTGQPEDPDESFMRQVERHFEIEGSAADFRRGLITRVAAFRLSNPAAPLVFPELFAELFWTMERSFYRERKGRIVTMVNDALFVRGGGGEKLVTERKQAAQHLVDRLVQDFGYDEHTVVPMLSYYQRHHDQVEE